MDDKRSIDYRQIDGW